MAQDEKTRYVKSQLENYIAGKGIDTRNNFRCLNPDHPDHNPSMTIIDKGTDDPHAYCFACGARYDTFDLIAIDQGLQIGSKDAFDAGYKYYGLSDDNIPTTAKEPTMTKEPIMTKKPQDTYNFNSAAAAAQKELFDTPAALDYLHSRGYTDDEIRRFGIGYDKKGHNHFMRGYPDNQSKSKTEYLYNYVYPFQDGSGNYDYFMTEISDRSHCDKYNPKYRKPNGIPGHIYNEYYLTVPEKTPDKIFVCEGIHDANAAECCGFQAIALNGVGTSRLIELYKERYKDARPDTLLVVALDNDTAGKDAADKLINKLQTVNIPFKTVHAPEGHKDFNAAFAADRSAFRDYLTAESERIENAVTDEQDAERVEYEKRCAAYDLDNFLDEIINGTGQSYYPTGFETLDKKLGGGIYKGALYTIGAISSLGKTTLCMQIMDNIAMQGHDVLIFSMEMSKQSLMSKSIARLTYTEGIKMFGNPDYAKTARDISTRERWLEFDKEDIAVIDAAADAYMKFAQHIYIIEGVGIITIKDIQDAIKRHIRITGNVPVVLIDYLQIIEPETDKNGRQIVLTDKQNTDRNITALRQLARDENMPIIAISSFNRESYTEPVTTSAFKESGRVEYSSDVLIGLQYNGMDYEGEENAINHKSRVRTLMSKQEEKAKDKRDELDIQVKILKQRDDPRYSTILKFKPMFSYFHEPGNSGISIAEKYESNLKNF